jgi:hypothetical protein
VSVAQRSPLDRARSDVPVRSPKGGLWLMEGDMSRANTVPRQIGVLARGFPPSTACRRSRRSDVPARRPKVALWLMGGDMRRSGAPATEPGCPGSEW